MRVRIHPHPLSGSVQAPPSKSASHRAVICALLAPQSCMVQGCGLSDDILATLDAARALGMRVSSPPDDDARDPNGALLCLDGAISAHGAITIDCAESGSTARFFLPIVCALGLEATFLGRGKLPQRPIGPLAREMQRHGAHFSRTDTMPFTVGGKLCPGSYILPGDISSQYVTGLLFALPLLQGESTLVLSTPLESAAYVEMTLQSLRDCGIQIESTAAGWRIPAPQIYRPSALRIEGDYSAAAFWLCAGALGSSLTVTGLHGESVQGDKAILPLLERMGTQTCIKQDGVKALPGDLRGISIDASPVPDLIPALAVAATAAQGTTVFHHAGRLRLKECDRLAAMADGITRLGGTAQVEDDRLIIQGGAPLRGGQVSGWGDHRIVMALAIAAAHCQQPVEITDAQAVSKSYPGFWKAFRTLGGIYDVL